jgi:hypothetical protein
MKKGGEQTRESTSIGFEKMLAWLMVEAIYGRAHFIITKGLKRADPIVLKTAPKFFEHTLGALADSVALHVARLFDQRSGSISIYALLSLAEKHAGAFKHGSAAEVRKFVSEAKRRVRGLENALEGVRCRRHETLAHSDPRAIVDRKRIELKGRVSFNEFENLFEETGSILNRLFLLYHGASVPLDLDGVKDYEQALDLIADAMCEQASRYEAEHKVPAPFPRPRKCPDRSD